jgi:hypothetical protein
METFAENTTGICGVQDVFERIHAGCCGGIDTDYRRDTLQRGGGSVDAECHRAWKLGIQYQKLGDIPIIGSVKLFAIHFNGSSEKSQVQIEAKKTDIRSYEYVKYIY